MADHGVSHVLMVPSLYRAVLDRIALPLPSLRVVIVAGEACPLALVGRHAQLLAEVALVNEYGPTEASVWATAHRLRPGSSDVPIGGPIPGTTVRVVGPDDQAVPAGVAGELLISGPGVAIGYLGDDSATAQRFVQLDGRRWYRTGDVARFVGEVAHFLGRVDDQLNVGGHRLEPVEIESELRLLPGVREAVVVVPRDADFLVAHLEADGFSEPRARAALASRVPAGWVPRRFVVHDRLPRNVHGKIDRRAAHDLAHDLAHGIDGAGSADPSDDRPFAIVDSVLTAWKHSFGRTDIDTDTDFFAIGGDSLLAVQIVSSLGDALGHTVPIAALLAGRTPTGMARLLGEPSETDSPAHRDGAFQMVQLRAGSGSGPLIVLTPAWDDVFGYHDLAAAFPDDVTVVALAYIESLDDRLVKTVDELVTEFLPRISEDVAADRPVAIVGWSIGGVVAAELAERLAAEGRGVRFVALIDTFFPGEERHLWSNRWWKYKSLLRPRTLPAALRELRVMARRRIERAAGTVGRRLIIWAGGEALTEAARTSVGGFPVEALGHPIAHVGTPMVFFAATTTNPARTFEKWRAITEEMTVVEVVGRHRGHDSIMGATRAGRIAGDLVDRVSVGPSC
jgi:thioesterase domain-containing protein/acyl carrier protein